MNLMLLRMRQQHPVVVRALRQALEDEAQPWDGWRTAGTLVIFRPTEPTPWVQEELDRRESARAESDAEVEERLTNHDPGIQGSNVHDLDDAAAVVARLLSAMERIDDLERMANGLPAQVEQARLDAEASRERAEAAEEQSRALRADLEKALAALKTDDADAPANAELLARMERLEHARGEESSAAAERAAALRPPRPPAPSWPRAWTASRRSARRPPRPPRLASPRPSPRRAAARRRRSRRPAAAPTAPAPPSRRASPSSSSLAAVTSPPPRPSSSRSSSASAPSTRRPRRPPATISQRRWSASSATASARPRARAPSSRPRWSASSTSSASPTPCASSSPRSPSSATRPRAWRATTAAASRTSSATPSSRRARVDALREHADELRDEATQAREEAAQVAGAARNLRGRLAQRARGRPARAGTSCASCSTPHMASATSSATRRPVALEQLAEVRQTLAEQDAGRDPPSPPCRASSATRSRPSWARPAARSRRCGASRCTLRARLDELAQAGDAIAGRLESLVAEVAGGRGQADELREEARTAAEIAREVAERVAEIDRGAGTVLADVRAARQQLDEVATVARTAQEAASAGRADTDELRAAVARLGGELQVDARPARACRGGGAGRPRAGRDGRRGRHRRTRGRRPRPRGDRRHAPRARDRRERLDAARRRGREARRGADHHRAGRRRRPHRGDRRPPRGQGADRAGRRAWTRAPRRCAPRSRTGRERLEALDASIEQLGDGVATPARTPRAARAAAEGQAEGLRSELAEVRALAEQAAEAMDGHPRRRRDRPRPDRVHERRREVGPRDGRGRRAAPRGDGRRGHLRDEEPRGRQGRAHLRRPGRRDGAPRGRAGQEGGSERGRGLGRPRSPRSSSSCWGWPAPAGRRRRQHAPLVLHAGSSPAIKKPEAGQARAASRVRRRHPADGRAGSRRQVPRAEPLVCQTGGVPGARVREGDMAVASRSSRVPAAAGGADVARVR